MSSNSRLVRYRHRVVSGCSWLGVALSLFASFACKPAASRPDRGTTNPAVIAASPQFREFPAARRFHGSAAPISFSHDSSWRQFRTRLEDARARGPNFAGSFALVTWGCGIACQSGALLDLPSGRVFSLPTTIEVAVAYRLDSRLLMIDPPESIAATYPRVDERPA